MEYTNKIKEVTGSGELGCPRPGEEGISRVPSPSLSGNRTGERVVDQACSSARTTGIRHGTSLSSLSGTEIMYPSDASSWGRSPPRKSTKRRRRAPSTTTSSDSDTIGSDNALECGLSEEEPQKQPPKKTTKRLPTDAERHSELRHEPSAVLAANILEAARSIEQMAATAKNLKGTYVRRMRDEAGKTRANVTELVMRTKATGSSVALERENIMLRAKLRQAQEEIVILKSRPQITQGRKGEGQQEAVLPSKQSGKKERLCLAPPNQVSPGTRMTRSKDRPGWREEEEMKKLREEMRSLAEQVAALKEIVVQSARDEMKSKEERQQQQLPNIRVGKPVEQRSRVVKKGGRQSVTIKEPSFMEAADSPATTSWAKVVGRKAKRKEAQREQEASGHKHPHPTLGNKGKRQPERGSRRTGNPPVRVPRRAAVALSLAPDCPRKGGEVLFEARSKINLKDLGITDAKIRLSAAGSVLVEIPGEDRAAKADILAGKLKEVFPESSKVKITRPVKRTDIRITGLDVSVRKTEVIEAVVNTGGCREEEVKIGEIRQRTPRGQGAVWLQCPTEAAKKLTDLGKVTVGWVSARVVALKPRPLACFKCHERGHTAGNCQTGKDRGDLCYNCSESGHLSRDCTAPPRCAICTDAGIPANHRYGGKECHPPKTRRSRTVAEPQADATREGTTKKKTPRKASDLPAASRSACWDISDEEAMEVAD